MFLKHILIKFFVAKDPEYLPHAFRINFKILKVSYKNECFFLQASIVPCFICAAHFLTQNIRKMPTWNLRLKWVFYTTSSRTFSSEINIFCLLALFLLCVNKNILTQGQFDVTALIYVKNWNFYPPLILHHQCKCPHTE